MVKDDFDKWHDEYKLPDSGGDEEYGKPDSMMDAVPTPIHQLVAPTMKNLYQKGNSLFLVKATFDDETLVENYGAYKSVWIAYDFSAGATGGKITTNLILKNKTPTRLAEATYFSFQPLGEGEWEHNIVGEWSKPLDVRSGASNVLHYVTEDGVRFTTSDMGETLQIRSMDAGLLRWGDPLPYPYPLFVDPDLVNFGAAFNLHNNIWST